MADHCHSIDTQPFHFQSQSPPGVIEGDHHQFFQVTVPLDGAVAPDSFFDETQLDTLDFDTQVVENADPIEDEYEKEVALDSEDEENPSAGFGTAANRLSDVAKRKSCPSIIELEHLAEASDVSVGRKGLNHSGSEEPRESSQANALNFVDNFLSVSNVDVSPETKSRNAARKKVSPVSTIKGCQTLAKRIETRTPLGKHRTFEWVDSDHCGGIDSFSKRMDTAFGLRSVPRHRQVGNADSKGRSSTDNKCNDKAINLHEKDSSSRCSNSTILDNSLKETSKIEQASRTDFENHSAKNQHAQSHAVQLGQEMDNSVIDRTAPDVFDVGFSTQIAAEAMEALSYGVPTNSSAGDVYQCLQDFHVDSLTGTIKKKIHSKKPWLRKGDCSNLENIARTSKQRKNSAIKGTSSSSRKDSSYQDVDNKMTISTKRKRSQYLAGRSDGMTATYPNESSARQCLKPAKERKKEKEMGKNKSKESENYGNSSIPLKNILLGKQCMQGEPVAYQTGVRMAEETLEAAKGGPKILQPRMNDIMKGSIITYKRKRCSLAAKQSGVLNAEGKPTKLCWKQLIKGEAFTHQTEQCMTGGEPEETEYGPDNQRNRLNDIMKDSIITYKRKGTAPSGKLSKVLSTEGKHTELFCNKSETGRNNKLTQQKQGSLEVSSLTSSFMFNLWSCPKGKRTLKKCPSQSNEASTWYAPIMEIKGKQGHKKPFSKNLPKSSLLKELIKLGIQEPKSDVACKDLRKRRDMSDVQVLFSQHLDDDVIKKQKKILARLGISISTCSMDATHFIADKFVRTRNMLEAIALGKPVVTPLWLENCGQASCLIDEKNYILRDAKKEKEIGFSLPVSLAHASQRPLLKGLRILITPNIKPEKEMVTSLVKAVHGQAVEQSQVPSLKIPDDLIILSCEEDHAICIPFLDKGAAVYSSELLLNGIVIQKLEYERNQLFKNHKDRICRPNKT